MAYYQYTAKNSHNETIKGKVEASSQHQAVSLLRERELLVIKLQQVETGGGLSALFQSSVSFKDIVTFTQQLATMINAGLSLAESLSILQQQSAKPAVFKMIGEILKDIEGGVNFGDALEKQPRKYFNRVYVQLVKAGELGGVLDDVMARLAVNMEKSAKLRAKIRNAMIYPVVIILAIVVAITLMMVIVVPRMEEMYADLGADLPGSTQVLISVSRFMINYWYLFLAIGVAVGVGFRAWLKTPQGRQQFDQFIFKIPVFGDLRLKLILTEFARTTSLLLGAGVSLLQALDIVANSMPSVNYQQTIKSIAKQVEKGAALSDSIDITQAFPSILAQMTAVGEETGKMDEVLGKLAKYFESEADNAVKALSTLIEPMIMVALGIGVGFMVVAIIMPIYGLSNSL